MLCLASDARRRGRGGSGCEICGRSGCWCVGGLIVGVVVAAPGGACGRLPVRAAARGGSCWARGCGRAGGFLPAQSVDDFPGGT